MRIRLVILLLGVVCLGISSSAEVPHVINYQGRLIDDGGNPVSDGYYDLTFTLYDHPTESAGMLWTSGEQSVGVTNGLFTYALGSNVPLVSDLTADSSLWLGITLSGEAEMTPRTQMTTVPYAGHAFFADELSEEGDNWINEEGDTLTGDLHFGTNGQAGYFGLGSGGCYLNMRDEGKDVAYINASGVGFVNLYNRDETYQVILSATDGFGGVLRLDNPNGTTTAKLGAGDGTSNLAGRMILYNDDGDYETRMESGGNGGSISFYKNGDYRMRFDAEHDGDASMELMDDAINAEEILDEPGVAANHSSASVELTSGLVTEDVITVAITIPAPGYIVVTAKARGSHSGTTGVATSYAQIDEYAGGSMVFPHYIVWGSGSYPSVATFYEPLFDQRIYYKSEAGTYTFRLEATRSNTSTGARHFIANAFITATYYPTSYGTVSTFVDQSEAGEFNNVEYISASNSIDNTDASTETGVKVDLRELETEVKRLEKELRRKRIELQEAQNRMNDEDIMTDERR